MYQSVLQFWFEDISAAQWWKVDAGFDRLIAERLFKGTPKDNYDFELRHKVIVDRFGRYPHRNAMLGRQSTEEELAFLAQPGSSF